MTVKPRDTLEAPALGMRLVFHRTAADTDGALLEYDVIGRPRGFPAQGHVHPNQTERHEVVSGTLKVTMDGQSRVLEPGESILIPAGTAHRHYADGPGEGHVRVELRPALADRRAARAARRVSTPRARSPRAAT